MNGSVIDLDSLPQLPASGVSRILFPERSEYHSTVRALRDTGFEMCVDLCAVDYLSHPGRTLPGSVAPERFEVVVNLLSLSAKERVRIRVQVPDDEPEIDTLFDLYPGTEAMEREVFDLMGLRFRDHPDLTRILMPDDWEGHPLRKDYDSGRIPVEFKLTEPPS